MVGLNQNIFRASSILIVYLKISCWFKIKNNWGRTRLFYLLCRKMDIVRHSYKFKLTTPPVVLLRDFRRNDETNFPFTGTFGVYFEVISSGFSERLEFMN